MSIFSSIKSHAVLATITAVVVVIVAVLAGRAATQKPATEVAPSVRKVSVVSAASFTNATSTVSVQGSVESHSQADLKSQLSAPIAIINASIGDTVYAGQVIMELSNADIRAQLAQAQAALATAQGQQYTGAISLTSARQSAIDKIRDAYSKSYDIVNSQVDPILYNNDGSGGRLQSYIVNTDLTSEMASIDVNLKSGFTNWKKITDALDASTSTEAVESALAYSQKNLTLVNTLLEDVSTVLNYAARYAPPTISAQLTVWKTTVSGALATASGASQALTGASSALSAAKASQSTTVVSGVSAAQAGVSNLEAQLAKTIIRSPISGKIATLPLREGELASPGTLLATVVGDQNDLQVKAYASGDDLQRLKIRQSAIIEGTVRGTVSNVAPSVDPTTKKAEVDIDVIDSTHSGLVVGENVTVSIQTGDAGTGSGYLLPIQDVKILPGSASVYTVGPDSKIQSNPVTIGQIQGDFVQVTSGIDSSMNIVSPVYELDPGETVTVQ